MKDIKKMTLGEVEEHRKINAEIEKEIGCKKMDISATAEIASEMTDYRGKYCIVRTYSAGVFAGILKARSGQEVEMTDARRLWYWDGAASLSQMANDGVKAPQNCKFAQPVDVQLLQAIEILKCTAEAETIIRKVSVWQR